MLHGIILALLAATFVAGQVEITLHTQGKGGVECGKYHRCLVESRCLKEDKTKLEMCLCPEEYEGNGKLSCYLPGDVNLEIQNDPHIKSFYKEYASLPSPCRYRLARLVYINIDKDLEGVIELYGENMLYSNGEYYLKKLILSSNLLLGSDSLKQVMEFTGDVSEDGLSYTFVAKSLNLEEEFESSIDTQSDVFNIQDSSYLGYYFNVSKIEVDNLLNVSIKDLGITLLYRPPSTQYKLDNTRLPFVPGAMFNIDYKYFKYVRVEEFDREISSWPEGPSYDVAAQDLNTHRVIYMQYLMLNNSINSPYYRDEICQKSSDIFVNECQDDDLLRVEMLKVCKSIHIDEKFLECLTRENTVDEYFTLQKEFFQRCMISHCHRDKDQCMMMKEEMPDKTRCELPKDIKDLDCESMSKPLVVEPKAQHS